MVSATQPAPVCVLGHDVALTLFPAEEALGRDVRVGLNYYRVIGIMEPGARSAASEASIDGPAHCW
jgi:putative ABC transport system permease protein